jgi:hypothetical protein
LRYSRPDHERFFFPRRKHQWPEKSPEEVQKRNADLRNRLQISGPEEEPVQEPINQPTCQQGIFTPRVVGVLERQEIYQRTVEGDYGLLKDRGEYEEHNGPFDGGVHWYKYSII